MHKASREPSPDTEYAALGARAVRPYTSFALHARRGWAVPYDGYKLRKISLTEADELHGIVYSLHYILLCSN